MVLKSVTLKYGACQQAGWSQAPLSPSSLETLRLNALSVTSIGVMLERWTRVVLRFRWVVLSFWLVVALAGGYASGHLNALLSNTFTVPGTDSETVRTILQKRFGDRSDGEFLVVFRSREPLPSLQQRLDRAAPSVPGGRPTPPPSKYVSPDWYALALRLRGLAGS